MNLKIPGVIVPPPKSSQDLSEVTGGDRGSSQGWTEINFPGFDLDLPFLQIEALLTKQKGSLSKFA